MNRGKDKKDLYGDRIEACIDIWGRILDGEIKERAEARDVLERYYQERNIEPIRGKTKIEIFDKELITLYIVGKYGLGVSEELDTIRSIFELEEKCENAFFRILKGDNVRDVMNEVFGVNDEPSLIFRVLRFGLTLMLLGFIEEDKFLTVLNKMVDAYEDLKDRFRGFARFYIALKIGEAIALGKVRNSVEKEALKHTLCLKLGFSKSAPPDEMIYDMTRSIFKVNDSLLKRILPKVKAS
ncbi:MAG: hypothetical protein DRJ66_03480 [Thermoprotei archaeon]|nr:MAG: hypothetical protein DRJ66_03480 [Thermoprotei archaeon]RLF20386.1 MAG: hypothetical protein DRZ82_02365 [Thermoprotei archaeon]